MTLQDIEDFVLSHYPDVMPREAWGEISFFLNPGDRFPRGAYFLTLKSRDGENDRASGLDRESVYRLNLGPEKSVYAALFGSPPSRPAKGGVVNVQVDFQALDVVMPHPVYGWMGWICVNNPSGETFERLKPVIDSAYRRAGLTLARRRSATSSR